MSVQPQPIGLSSEDRDALQAYIDEWIDQCLARDWDALVERLTDDVVFLPPDEPAVIGKAAAADFFEAFPVMTQFSAPILHVDGRADFAGIRGSFDMTVETEEGEARMVGKWLCTYRKEGGRWRCATDCWNLDAPAQG